MSLADALVELQQLTERLRRDCPWDREQTTRTIVPHTVEEAYEVADAAFGDDDAKLLDEIGDLLFQSYFLALLLQERGTGDLETAARSIHAKLVSRHPHVFGDAEARTAGRVRERWEELKRENEGREGVFHDVPEGLPALLYARKVQARARAVGFEYPDVAGAVADLDDELRELRVELPTVDPAPETEPDRRLAAELGDVLFAVVNVALVLGWLAVVAALNPAYRQQLRTFRSLAARDPSSVPTVLTRERTPARPRDFAHREGSASVSPQTTV